MKVYVYVDDDGQVRATMVVDEELGSGQTVPFGVVAYAEYEQAMQDRD